MTQDSNNPVGRPMKDDKAATGWIQTRVTMARKNAYVKAARKTGKKLTDWIFENCDKAANYKP